MKRSLSRRIEHLAQVVAPCAACEERARQDEESRKSMASLAERLQGAALAREQAKGAAAWKSEAVRLSAEAAELRQRASMLEATDWRAALAEERERRAEAQRQLYRAECLCCRVARDDSGYSPAVRSLAARLGELALETTWDPGRIVEKAQRLEEQAAEATHNAATAEASKIIGEDQADKR